MTLASQSYLGEAAEYAQRSLDAPNAEAREHWRGLAEWALRLAHRAHNETA